MLVCWIRTIPHQPIICGILITRHTLPYIFIITPFCPLMRIFQDDWRASYPVSGEGPSEGLLWVKAFTDGLLATKCLSFHLNCSVAGNNRVGQKALNVVMQILGQVEMKEIYFWQNVLFISVCKTSGEPLPPQVRPTSLTCGTCGNLCDAVVRLSAFCFSLLSWYSEAWADNID